MHDVMCAMDIESREFDDAQTNHHHSIKTCARCMSPRHTLNIAVCPILRPFVNGTSLHLSNWASAALPVLLRQGHMHQVIF